MMDVVNEEGIHTAAFMTSAQIGKTEGLLNIVGYFVDQDPSPMLVMQPTLQMAEAFSKDRLAPMFRDTPALSSKVGDPRSKDTANTLLHKKFPGGHVTMCGANSPASLASRPIRVVAADEIDRYPVSAGTEGDPLSLARKRTATFHNRMNLFWSTPTVEGASRIKMAWEESDQRRYYVPCPECGVMQTLQWRQVTWAKGEDGHWDGSDPWYECEACECEITEADKMAMLRAGRWVAESFSDGIAGFHLNELYSPWRRWREVVSDFMAAKGDTELMRVWVNTSLGETFEEGGDGVEATDLYARREVYSHEVPAGGLVLTAGVDVQDDRLEAEVFAWGMGQERWSVTYRVLWGNPAEDAVWEELDDIILNGRFGNASGASLGVASTCIDSGGHHTQAVYEYCRARQGRRVFPTVGRAGFGRPIVSQPSRKRHGRGRRPVDLFTLGVDEAKTHIHGKLQLAQPGPGYCHFPENNEYGEEYFAQLAAEVVQTQFVRGVPRRVWKQIRPRNEALDINVLGYAALILLNPNFGAIAKRQEDATDEPAKQPTPMEQAREQHVRRTRSRRTGNGFTVNGWKK